MIRVDLTTNAFALGDRVKGKAVWNAGGTKHPRKIEVMCRWRIEGKKKEDSVIDVRTEERTESRSEIVIPFDFEIPFDEPVTYDGKLFRIIWEIVARADMPFASDEIDAKVITVKPPVWTADQFREWWEKSEEGDDEDDEDEGYGGDDEQEVTER